MNSETIAAGFARALVAFAAGRGADRGALCAQAGIEPEDLDELDGRLPLARYIALLRAAKAHCREPALALHFGESFDLADISILGVMGQTAGTVFESVELTNRYAGLAVDLRCPGPERFRLEPAGGGCWVVDCWEESHRFPELIESAFARAMTTCRHLFGATGFVKEVQVMLAAPSYRREYDRIFGVPVAFGSGRNAMRMDGAWARQRIPPVSSYVRRVLVERADALMNHLERAASMRSRVERLVARRLVSRDVGVKRVAGALALSRQTLFRRLKAEGVTFEQVLDDVRRRRALQCLESGTVTVKRAAYLAGFSEPSAFSRAFRRWTGCSPGRFHAQVAKPRHPMARTTA